MKKPRIKRLEPGQYKRVSIAVSALLVLLLIGYAEVIRPNQDANAYVSHLDNSSKPLEQCFEKLADTTQLRIFYAPDIELDAKRGDTARILKRINECQTELRRFENESHELVNLHLSGYTKPYQQAKVYQRQAYDIVGQSNDVLSQYSEMASFLSQYYDHLMAFNTYTTDLEANRLYINTAQLNTIAQQAADLRERAAQVRTLEAPKEFDATKTETADMLSQTADGLDAIVSGYRIGNSYTADAGYDKINKAVANYDSRVINLPFQQLTKSYIPQQVNQLPGKVANLLVSSSE